MTLIPPLSVALSLMSLTLNHPLTFTIMIIIQTLASTLFLTSIYQTSWFSYILFLVFIGALLVLFIYIATLASNEMFVFNPLSMMMTMAMTALLTILFMTILPSTQAKPILTLTPETSLNLMINKFYAQNLMMTLILMLYLLLTLLIVAKISNIKKGPLRHSN